MESSVQREVVKILLSDKELYERRRDFYNCLNLPEIEFEQLNTILINGTETVKEFLAIIISRWVAKTGNLATVERLRDILEENGFQLIADLIKEKFALPSQKKGPISFELSNKDTNFFGRSKELKQLQKLFDSDKRIVTITGMGGVGKSELAKIFARILQERTEPVDCIWFNGQNWETLKKSVERLAKTIGVPTIQAGNKQPKTVQATFVDSITSIKSKKKVLVIIDNVDESDQNAQSLIEATIPENHCFFLVTSRNLSVLDFAGEIIKLDIFPDEEAQDLITQLVPDESLEDVKDLCKLLHNFPLALQQAVAYIKRQKLVSGKGQFYKISDYIKDFETQKKKKLLGFPLIRLEHEYEETTLVTWNMSINKIIEEKNVGNLAIEILNSIAYFEPDDIEMKFLKKLNPSLEEDVGEAVELIKTYSLVKVEDNNISIHRLVQQVIRINLNAQEQIITLKKLQKSISLLFENGNRVIGLMNHNCLHFWIRDIDIDYKVLSFPEMNSSECLKRGMPHIVSLRIHVLTHTDFGIEFKSDPFDIFNILDYFQMDKLRIIVAKIHHDTILKNFEADSRETLQAKSELAYTFFIEFHFKINERLEKLENVYSKQKSLFGEGDASTLKTLYYMARLHLSKWDHHKGLECYKHLADLYSQSLGPEHKLSMRANYKLAKLLNRKEEGTQLYEKCYHWDRTHLGQGHIETLCMMTEYGYSLLYNHKFEQAKNIFEQILGLKPMILLVFDNWIEMGLAKALYYLGEENKALDIFEQNVRKLRNKKAREFTSKKSNYENADILFNQGRYQEAMIKYEEVNIYNEKNMLSFILLDHSVKWRTTEPKFKIALCLIELKDFRGALDFLKIVLEGWIEEAGINHELTINTKKFIAEVEDLLKAESEVLKRQCCTCTLC